MNLQGTFKFLDKKIIIYLRDRICETPEELISSELFFKVVLRFCEELKTTRSPFLNLFGKEIQEIGIEDVRELIQVLRILSKMPMDTIPKLVPGGERFITHPHLMQEFVEALYNFWRAFDRFILCDSTGDRLDRRPFRTFNGTIESLTHLVRQTYRDIEENISGKHPNIYRQVRAGAELAVIALPKNLALPGGVYRKLADISVIRQILMYPPLLLNPPMNKRTGKFERININPLERVEIKTPEWLCYPAKVGSYLVLVYINERFYELGLSLCNLFELAEDDFLNRPVDAVYLFGVPGTVLDDLAPLPTVFYDDEDNKTIVGACPNMDQFGYFGYLKKMILTLHNIKVLKQGKMPYHGALVRILTKNDFIFTILVIGDTGAGKSETLEAFRIIGKEQIKEITIIADDMGSLDIDKNGKVIGYGTEVGAFVRLDDLQPGYAFGQLDRSIIMNPGQQNARIVLPVTTYEHVVKGYPIDMVLYANNYEEIDDDHPIIDRLSGPEMALHIFREGTAMSKGTTTSTGLVHTYFVNVFGAVQYKNLHEQVVKRFFEKFFKTDIFVGQLRTRLGIPGWEQKGPEEAARKLLAKITAVNKTAE
ncbi:phosphoenolpyruvate carboxykinase [candidate division KSB1 bacterium]|nr:phosphoenolpyruvate carboxykinase [candidate division KSB1 bacterium]